MASITCGNCKATHASAAEVKTCFGNSGALPDAPLPTPSQDFEAQRQAARTSGPAATEKQVAFMTKLASERGVDVPVAPTKKEASAAIERLLALPKVDTPAAEELEDGVYLHDGKIYKVIHAVHGSGKQYAKVLEVQRNEDGTTSGTFEYAGRQPLASITAADRLTAEKAREYGLLYGMCVNCARDLTKEESIHVGYGQTCARNNGWTYPTKKEFKALLVADA